MRMGLLSRSQVARGGGWGGKRTTQKQRALLGDGAGPNPTARVPPLPAHTPLQPEARRGPGAYLGQLRQDAVPPHGRQNVHFVCGLAGLPGRARNPDPPWSVGTRRSLAAVGYRQSPGATGSLLEPSASETLRPPRAKGMRRSPRVWESPQSPEPGAFRRPPGGGETPLPLAVGGESRPGEPGPSRTLQ